MSTQPLPNAPTPAADSLHPNPAVAQCLQRWDVTYKANLAIRQSKFEARECAAEAYRKTMPSLEGHQNISNFIACVAHGVLIGAIDRRDSSKLLYAAQVALSLLRVRLTHPANPPAPAENSPIPGTLSAG